MNIYHDFRNSGEGPVELIQGLREIKLFLPKTEQLIGTCNIKNILNPLPHGLNEGMYPNIADLY